MITDANNGICSLDGLATNYILVENTVVVIVIAYDLWLQQNASVTMFRNTATFLQIKENHRNNISQSGNSKTIQPSKKHYVLKL
uniref:Uncharacterized protein n=1 Tax=Loa loa TaxID=7209 RepID=A0A1I7VGX6_LOALO